MKRKLTYKGAGVDIDLKQRLIPQFRRLAQSTLGHEVIEGIGGFGAMVALNGVRRMRSPVLVSGTDSVGTKLNIAFATGQHDTVGIDCVAMCVNDIICHAAKPLFFLDYIGTGKLDARIAAEIVKGVARGCALAGASLVGGETAQLPGLYGPGEYDLVGFAVGVAERARIPSPARMRAGDALVGLASSGLHSNGFSLARKVLLERAKLKLGARVPELGCTLAEECAPSHPDLCKARDGIVPALRYPGSGQHHRRRAGRESAARDAERITGSRQARELADTASLRAYRAARKDRSERDGSHFQQWPRDGRSGRGRRCRQNARLSAEEPTARVPHRRGRTRESRCQFRMS